MALNQFLDSAWFFVLGGIGFVLVITLVVFFHELGHFLAARFFGVRVESFSIGFGRSIAGFTDRYGTKWKIGWLPLGGYVKFWGDDGVSSTPDQEKIDHATAEERLASFHHKPLYQKAVIAAGGPIANFILAIVILTGLYSILGDTVVSPQIGGVAEDSAAERAGLKPGDIILSIDGARITEFSDIPKVVSVSRGQKLNFQIKRDGETLQLVVIPSVIEIVDMLGNKAYDTGIGVRNVISGEIGRVVTDSPAERAGLKSGDVLLSISGKHISSFAALRDVLKELNGQAADVVYGKKIWKEKEREFDFVEAKTRVTPGVLRGEPSSVDQLVADSLGVYPAIPGGPESKVLVRFDPISAFWRGVDLIKFILVKTMNFLGHLLTGSGDYRQLSGPIGIAQVSGHVFVNFGFASLLNLAAVLSVSIGLLNLFPIPMLDGGHLLYYGIEAVRGRPLGERAQELGFKIGLALVVSLFLFATWNDLTKLRLF